MLLFFLIEKNVSKVTLPGVKSAEDSRKGGLPQCLGGLLDSLVVTATDCTAEIVRE